MRNVFITLLLLVLVSPSVAFAQSNFREGKSITVRSDEVINDNLFVAGDSVMVSGTVNGDLYVIGGDVILEGIVNGDILAAGGNLNIKGQVLGNVRAVGGQIIVSGPIAKNLSVAGGQLTLTESASVGGGLVAATGSLDISAPISKNVQFIGGKLSFSNSTKVDGNVVYYSDEELLLSNGASVSGQITRYQVPQQIKEKTIRQPKKVANAASIVWTVISFCSTLAFGLIIVKLFPGYTSRTSIITKNHFWSRLGIGLLSLFVVPVSFIVLILTIVGIPFAFMSLLIYLLSFYFARIFVAVTLGGLILSRFSQKHTQIVALLTGLIIYYLLGLIPIVGSLLKYLLLFATLGAIYWRKSPATAS